MKQIPLTQNKVALVDDEDWELVSQYKWYAHKCDNQFYARTNIYKEGKRTLLSMHQLLTGGKLIDHINGNGLDNRRENLRPCTTQQNGQNSTSRIGTSSYKGVSFDARRNKWFARIYVEKKNKFLGYFADEKIAAIAYNKAATEYFGEFAKLNFIREV